MVYFSKEFYEILVAGTFYLEHEGRRSRTLQWICSLCFFSLVPCLIMLWSFCRNTEGFCLEKNQLCQQIRLTFSIQTHLESCGLFITVVYDVLGPRLCTSKLIVEKTLNFMFCWRLNQELVLFNLKVPGLIIGWSFFPVSQSSVL